MKILLWPNDSLKKVCDPVEGSDRDFRDQLAQMKVLASTAGGIGLAANQVGILKRMLIAFKPGEGWKEFVNPRLLSTPGKWITLNEGCLSLPGIFLPHRRNTEVIVEHQDVTTGALVAESFGGQLAHILQHEIEHLDGKMMIDGLKGGQRDQIRNYMKKLRKTR